MLDNEHLVALGAVAERAAAVEKVVRVLASELIDDDERVGAVLLGRIPFSAVAAKLGPLATLRPLTTELQAEITECARGAVDGMNRRNELLHSHWESESAETLQIRGKAPAEPYAIEVTVEDIDDVARDLKGSWSALHICWLRVVIELGRNEPDPNETRPGFTTVPNRWRVVESARPSPSRSKTPKQRWTEGRISSAEFEALQEQRGDAIE